MKKILNESKKENILKFFKDLASMTKFLNKPYVKEHIEKIKKHKNYPVVFGKPFDVFLDYFHNIENNVGRMFTDKTYLQKISNMEKKLSSFIKNIEENNLVKSEDLIDFENFKSDSTRVLNYMKNLIKDFDETRKEFNIIMNNEELRNEHYNDLKKLKEGKMKKGNSVFKEWKRKKAMLTETAKKILGKDDIVLEYFMKKSIEKYLKENKIALEKLSKDDYKMIQKDPELAPYMDMYGSPSKEKEEMGKRVKLSDKLQQKIAENGIDLNCEELEMFMKHFDRMVRNKRNEK